VGAGVLGRLDHPAGRGETELVYANRTKRCGAYAILVAGRVRDLDSSCPDTLASGAGIGSTFREAYGSFPSGSMRCLHNVWHSCYMR